MTQPHLEFLPRRMRLIFFMCEVLGLTKKEVAQYLRLKMHSVGSSLQEARYKLKSYDDSGKPLWAMARPQRPLTIGQEQLLRGTAIVRQDSDPKALVGLMRAVRARRLPAGSAKPMAA